MILSGYGYTASAGDTFDFIALKIYGDEKYAEDLLCANPEICNKTLLSGGEVLKLPVVEIIDTTESGMPYKAPWKE